MYVGKYKWGKDTLSIIKKRDGIYVVVEDNAMWKIYFKDKTHFFVLEQKDDLNFVSDKNKITGFTIGKGMAKKIE
jgi:hypothetical protein